MKRIYLLILLAGIGYGGLGQEAELKGRVLSGEQPVPHATLNMQRKKIIADSTGIFSVPGLTSGKTRVRISAVGFEGLDTLLDLNPGSQTMNFGLKPLFAQGEEVVVTGTLRAVRRSESPVAVEVFTPQFFKKDPAPSIFEALQHVTGVRPQLNCNVCNTGDIHINGLEGPYTMVTIDGMPIVSSLASVYGLFGIPVQLIDRVEIVKGPASGLYGSEAIGGLVNIITKSPDKAPRLTLESLGTSWLETGLDLGTRGRLGKKATNLLGINYYNYSHPVDKNHDGFTDLTLQHRVSVFNKISWNRPGGKQAHLAARYFYEDRWGGQMNWTPKFRGGDSIYGESIYTNRWELIGNYELPVPGKWFFSFSATGHDQNSYYGTTSYQGNQKIIFGQMLWYPKWFATHNTLIGFAGRYNDYDDNSTATIDTLTGKNRPNRYILPGIFVQDEWKLSPGQSVLSGLRLDHHPVHGLVFTPRLAYKFSWSEKNVLRLNAGTGFRVVNLFTEEHAALTGARAVEVTEELQPEKSYNLNLNYNTRWKSGIHHFYLDASAWYSYFNNQILPDYDSDPNKIIYRNSNGFSKSTGASVNLDWNWGNRLKTRIGMTWQDVSRFEEVNEHRKKIPLILTEKWSGNWSVAYSIPSWRLNLDYTGTIYGPMRLPLISDLDPRPEFSPVFSQQNLQATFRLNKTWEFFGGIKNIWNWTPAKATPFLIARADDPFDKNVQFDPNGQVIPSPENPYALSFDPGYVYASNQGRRFFIGIRYQMQ